MTDGDSANGNGEYFISPSRGKRDFFQVVGDVVDFVCEDEQSRYSIVVGTDSGLNNGNNGLAEFVSVVTVHRVGNHGRYFWKKIPAVMTFNRRDRILKEANFSLELAQRVVAELRNKLEKKGLTDKEIERIITRDLGHERRSMARHYLSV